MKSRYLSNLEAKLAQGVDPSTENETLGRIAFHYARLGKTEAATTAIDRVRHSASQDSSGAGAAVCWINLAEGVIEHYAANNGKARNKWERSRAVARSLGHRPVAALSNAWLALSSYLAEHLEALKDESTSAITFLDDDNYSAISRLSLNVALCFHYGDEIASARDWYTRCRLAAVKDGDEATLAALMHSMSWMSISSKRNQALLGELQGPQSDLLATTAETVESYELLVGAENLPAMTPLLLAQDYMLDGRLELAIELIDKHCAAAYSHGFGRLAPGLLADRAYCLALLGRLREAEADARTAGELLTSELHSDDLAILHSRLYATFSLLKIDLLSDFHGKKAVEARSNLASFKREMVATARIIEKASETSSAFRIF